MNDFISTADMAKYLGVHRVTAAMIVRSGRISAIKVANRWLVRKEDLEKFAKGYTAKPGRPFGISSQNRESKT